MKPTAVITDGAPNTAPVRTRDELVNELAAVTLALLDKREARTKANKAFNADIKDLEKRTRELATTCRAAGITESLQMNFGSVIASREPGEGESDN